MASWKNFFGMFSSTPKVLVTGGLGYIGSHTVVELINMGFETCIIDNLSNSNIKILDNIEQITGKRPLFENIDVTDYIALDRYLSKQEDIKCVVHFAATKAVYDSIVHPIKYYRNNVLGMTNVMEMMMIHKIQGIVFSSSCNVYGQPKTLPVDETAPTRLALSPYSKSKQMCEEILFDVKKANSDIRAISLRYFNPIGAHPTGLIGELPNGVPNNLVPFITQTVSGIRKDLKVFGDDYNTPDGSCIRDYIDVVDLAKAHVKAVERILSKKLKQVEVYNLGTGRGVSVLELIDKFEEVNNVNVPYKVVERREGDIEQVWADPTLANKTLKWQAEVSLEESLRNAWNWQQKLNEARQRNEARNREK